MSSSLHEVIIRVVDEATKSIKGIEKASQDLLGVIERNREGIESLQKVSGAVFAGMAALGGFAVKTASEMQDLRVSLDTLTGSAEKGKELFLQIQDEAQKTPFDSKSLAQATSTMLGFGVAQEEVIGHMRMLGDISLGDANKLQSLALVFGQVKAAGKLTGGDLLQLINVGFNPLEVIAQKTGKSIAELRGEMEKGKISYDMIADAMKSATSEGGRFFNGMDNSSKTFSGRMAAFGDSIQITLAALGGFANGEVIKGGFLDQLTQAIAKVQPYLDSISEWAGKNPEMAQKIMLTVVAISGLVLGFTTLALSIKPILAGLQLMVGPLGWIALTIGALYLAWTNNFGGIQEKTAAFLAWINTNFVPFVQKIVTAFREGFAIIQNVVMTAWQNIQSVWAEKGQGIIDSAMFLWNTVKTAFNDATKYISDIVNRVLSWMREFWDEWGEYIMEGVHVLWEYVKMIFSTTLSIIGSLFKGGLDFITGYFNFFAGIFTGDWSRLWTGIKQILISILGTIGNVINDILKGVLSWIDTIFGTDLKASWTETWNKLTDFIKNIFSGDVLSAAGEALGNLGTNMKEWAGNMVEMFVSGIKEKWNSLKDTVVGIPGVLKEYLGFASPTEKGPASDSDRWMPNFMKMLVSGIKGGEGDIEKAIESVAKQFAKINKGFNADDIKQAVMNIKRDTESMFKEITSQAEKAVSNIDRLKNEIKKIGETIEGLKQSQLDDEASARMDIAKRAIELEKQIADIRNGGATSGEDIDKLNQLRSEQQLAMSIITREEYSLALAEAHKSETQKMIDKMNEKRAKYDEEILKQQELLKEKTAALSEEEKLYTQLMDTKKSLEEEYFAIFKKNIEETKKDLNEAISLLQRLQNMQGKQSAPAVQDFGWGPIFGGARASGGPVSSGKTYLVGERGPELFVPPSNGKIVPNHELGGGSQSIAVNFGTVNVYNEADENRLVDKIKSVLYQESKYARLGY